MKRIIGIDLGTTNSCAAYVQHGIPRVIPTEKGYNTLPSVVGFNPDGTLVFGQSAKERLVLHPKTTLHSTKRLLGRHYDSRAVHDLQGFFDFDIVAAQNGEAVIKLEDGRTVSPSEVGTMLLRQIARVASEHLKEDVREVVISVPAYFSDLQRQAVKRAAAEAGLNVRRLVNEPTAASLAYGVNRGIEQRVLVYDLGGGTFDVSILDISANVFEVEATGGDNFLGGTDFDNRIIAWALEEFQAKEQIDLGAEPVAVMQRLRAAAEAAKQELSLLMTTDLRLPFVTERRGKPVDLALTLSRDTLNALTADLIARTIEVTQKLLDQRSHQTSDIAEVILVGGMTRMPAVQAALQKLFGRAPKKGVHPDEVVAQGAALLGDSLDRIDSVTLIDVLSVPIGVGIGGGKLMPIFNRNQRLPAAQSMTLPTARDDQTKMEIDFYQGDTAAAYEADYLGTLVLDDIPAKKAGQVKVKVDVQLDSEGLMRIDAEDGRGGKKTLTLQALGKQARGRFADKVAAASDPANTSRRRDAQSVRAVVRGILGRK
ncbi:MAG: Hsp70 family protein [Deltaproteobacteria bacterium]|nr:Hsp70 family protein [Deltaproteobacteria bacterium]